MATANEIILDAEISHAVDLQQYSNGVVRRMIAILNRSDADLFAELVKALEKAPASASVARLDALLRSVRELSEHAYQALEAGLTTELRELAAIEAGHQYQLFRDQLPAVVAVATVPAAQAYTAALSRPFQGRLLREWIAGLGEDQAIRIRDAVRMGYLENQTIDQIVRRVRGSRALNYKDGIIEINRRHAEAVVRTAVSHMAGFTRQRFYESNGDLIKSLEWVSTLDTRTSPQCQIRDGKHYSADTHRPIGHSVPWGAGPGALHWNCRSTSAPVLKSWRELGVDEDEITPSTRSSLDGQVPEGTTYADWLAKQSSRRQDEVLGPSRGKMLREGKLTVDRFFNDKGRFLTLDELRQRDARLFQTA